MIDSTLFNTNVPNGNCVGKPINPSNVSSTKGVALTFTFQPSCVPRASITLKSFINEVVMVCFVAVNLTFPNDVISLVCKVNSPSNNCKNVVFSPCMGGGIHFPVFYYFSSRKKYPEAQ